MAEYVVNDRACVMKGLKKCTEATWEELEFYPEDNMKLL